MQNPKSIPESIRESFSIPVIIIGKPGRLMDSLISIVKAHPAISEIKASQNLPAALESIQLDRPYMIIVDSSVSGMNILQSVQSIKLNFPEAQCIVIAETLQQYHQALMSPAADVLLKGFSTKILFSKIDQIVSTRLQSVQNVSGTL